MKFSIEIKYYHPDLYIGLEDLRNAWYMPKDLPPVQLKTIIYRGILTYRLPFSGKRISYRTLKKGLIKKEFTIQLPLFVSPF
jgi:hypothetical protein